MGALVSKVWPFRRGRARAAQHAGADDEPSAPAYDERGRRRSGGDERDVAACALLVGNMQVGKSVLVMRTFGGHTARQVVHLPYVKTIGVDVTSSGEGDVQMWDTAGDVRFRGMASTYAMHCALIIVCYSTADADALQHIEHHVRQLRGAALQEKPLLLIGLRGDEPRAVSLDEVCECAARNRVRCFGSDVAALPIAYDDWAEGAIPARVHAAGAPTGAGAADSAAASVAYLASETAQRVDWRAAFRRRVMRTGYGITTICRAPVIEFSSVASTDEQAVWLGHLLHDLTIENSLMDVAVLERDTEAGAALALAMAQ